MKNVAILLAAGQGKRMNSDVSKQYLLLKDKPILYYSLEAFENSFIDEVILVVGNEDVDYCKKEIVEKYQFRKVKSIITGGKERYHSVYNGLMASGDCDYIYIHDGARPFLTSEILNRAKEAVQEFQACIVGMPVKDTIKIASVSGFCESTPNRDQVWMIQTPQVFSYLLIKEAYEKLISYEKNPENKKLNITDDAMVVETFSKVPIKFIQGSYKNIKITTPEDLEIAKIFL